MADLDHSHHFFRHIKKSWTDGTFVDPAAFRLAKRDGQFEEGLSVNWMEYFQRPTPQESIAPLREILINKGRSVGGESKFALLNVGTAKAAAAAYTAVAIVTDAEELDASHALVKGYEAHNDEVAEELGKVIIGIYPAKP
ncbi:MAG TPA: hypothetical protein VMX16_08175 [Terriglobia bacterium]|nr:hypothetical protein [Terriglobia bacterium]